MLTDIENLSPSSTGDLSREYSPSKARNKFVTIIPAPQNSTEQMSGIDR